MKFLVIMRPNGHPYGIEPDERQKYAGELRQALASGDVEVAYAFVSGGGAFVVNANASDELIARVRMNPYFKGSRVDVIPVVDADAFIGGNLG